MTRVILSEMKTAISLPDDLFQAADELAARMGIARSQLYARALALYLAQHSSAQVTATLNEVYADSDSPLDPELARAQDLVVGDEQW